ncbi:MAG: PAS domain S-box protein, partial [Gammaproteobacteria bacterium]|nr:PAS domain S-box protein [Gammaproteobacteria bacterium]
MNREQILQILYEMALVTGGETHVKPLITKTLQRLLYHTAFPCGVFISGITKSKSGEYTCKLEQVVGCGKLLNLKASTLTLTKEFIHRDQTALITDMDFISSVFGKNLKYKTALRLPVNNSEEFILLSKNITDFKIPFERIFEPVLQNFSKTLKLCRDNERHTSLLELEIAHRKQLDISLRESKNLLQNVLNTVPSRIFWKNKNSVYLGCNDLFAYDAGLVFSEDIIGKTDTDLPWGKTQASSYRKNDRDIINSGEPKIRFEDLQTRQDGTEIWLEISIVPLKNSLGEIIGVLGSYDDITNRKKMELAVSDSETRHRTIFESTVDGIINIDNKGAIESINPAVINLFGYAADELVGNNISMLMPEPFASKHDGFMSNFKQSGNATILGRGRELIAQRKDGTTFPVDIALDRMIINGHHMFTGIIRDVTERKEAEKKIITAKEEAELANHAKSDFLSRMSHELRTPLNAILGFAQLIDFDDSLPTLTKSNVQEIINGGHHLLTLINDVLDLAKIESGHVDLSLEPVIFNALILECISLIEPIANQNNIQIHNLLNPEKIVLRTDKTRVKQVILNLLSNAVKYNRRGGQVNISVNLSNNNLYRISITDTGTGIKEKNITKLFESFNRLDAENTDIEGTGIGLVITKHLVELMNGRLGVETEYGAGSTFWIELPKESSSDYEESKSTEEKIATQLIDDNHKSNILYIEDNPANLKLVIQLFANKQHIQLFTAHTASLGLELAETKCPDLILLDINLPEMDGYKVLEKLLNNDKTRNIPVIAVSANAMPKDLIQAEKAGFNDYLTKPLDIK